jgi:signal transduction histidine kinase
MLAHVFDPFWQVECTVDHSRGGLGLGLALVRKLVKMHGGSVNASSPGLGLGSEFVVRLPANLDGGGECACQGQQTHVGALLT